MRIDYFTWKSCVSIYVFFIIKSITSIKHIFSLYELVQSSKVKFWIDRSKTYKNFGTRYFLVFYLKLACNNSLHKTNQFDPVNIEQHAV